MTLVVDKFRSLLPARAKSSPSGWTSFNAPCCHHRGHSPDTRKRGGLRFDHGIVYNCFNCKYTASWLPGRQLTEKFKSLCRWLGANDIDINTMILEALKTESADYIPAETKIDFYWMYYGKYVRNHYKKKGIDILAPISDVSDLVKKLSVDFKKQVIEEIKKDIKK